MNEFLLKSERIAWNENLNEKGEKEKKFFQTFQKINKINPSSCSEWMEYWRWSFKNIKTYSTCMQLLIYGSVSGFEVGNHCKE